MKNINFRLIILALFLLSFNIFAQNKSLINTFHLDHLYNEIIVNNDTMGIVRIYSDYPDFKYVEAKGEGVACVDDAARAEVFYLKYYELHPNSEVLNKIKNLTNFLLYMQAKNGFFYNFIWKDFTIDSTYRTSVAEPNWWTWRAIWTLSEAAKFYKEKDPAFSKHILKKLSRTVDVVHNWLKDNYSDSTKNYGGFTIPEWLPFGTAADQAAIIVKGFCVYYGITKDEKVKEDIIKLCSGIEKMQVQSDKYPPYYCFLSWENSWHGWGNSQADALIDAGKLLNNNDYIKHAEKEIKYFYPYLIKKLFFIDFNVEKKGSEIIIKDEKKFSQIAYQIRPMVWACLNLNSVRKNEKVEKLAGKIGSWFFGNNDARKKMYNPENGVCYDGILSKDEINKNSGAESTVEALLTLLEIEKNDIARNELQKCENN